MADASSIVAPVPVPAFELVLVLLVLVLVLVLVVSVLLLLLGDAETFRRRFRDMAVGVVAMV